MNATNVDIFFHILQNHRHSLSVHSLDMRTTSSVESMHGVFSKHFPKHPNIFDFIANLRQHESTITDKIEQLVDDDGPSQMIHEKDRIRDEKINRYSKLLRNKSISFKQFLSEMSKESEIDDNSGLESEIEIGTESGCEIGESSDDESE